MKNQDVLAALRNIHDDVADPIEPTFDELIAYREGRMSADAEASLRERIVWSQTAVATLSAMAPTDVSPTNEPPVSDIELAAVRRLVRRDRQPRWAKSFVPSVAALLIAAIGVAGLGWNRVTKLEDQVELLRSPEPDVAIVEIHRFMRSGDGQRQKPIEVAAGHSTIFLFTTDPNLEHLSYRVEIVDSVGEAVWQYDGLNRNQHGELTFRLPARSFPAGLYELLLVGVGDDRSEILESPFIRFGNSS